jgi:phosphotransacetylase
MLSYSTGESGAGSDVEKVRQAAAIARSAGPTS